MKKRYTLMSCLIVLVATMLVIGPHAYADSSDPMAQFQDFNAHRDQVESTLGIGPQFDVYPKPTSYYDDLEAHYEQVLIAKDEIDKDIS